MTIGNFGLTGSKGNINHTQLNMDGKEHIPHGQITDVNHNNIHLPFSRNEVNFRNKRYYSVIPEIEGFSHDYDYDNHPLTQKNPTVSVFNDLYNFNATHKEVSQFHPHETEQFFHMPKTRPRMEMEKVYDMEIPDKINTLKKKTAPDFIALPEHSLTLQKRRK